MLKKWLMQKLSGNADEKLEIDSDEQELSGLNLNAALDAHNAWKSKLNNELSGHSSETLNVETIAVDDVCELGKWMYGTGQKKYSSLAEYELARKAHAEFHIAAAEVVIEHQSGNAEVAQNLMKTRFRTASNNNKLELVKLFVAARYQ